MEQRKLELSSLGKTWIFDLDGTLVLHNGHKEGEDQFLPGALALLQGISSEDYILFLTARKEEDREKTILFLKKHQIPFHEILFGIPMGERLLFNDNKPSGLTCAYAVECTRNEGVEHFSYHIDQTL